jgi:hypothetical protein
MKNMTVPLPLAAVAVLITGAMVSIATRPANVLAQGSSSSSYAEDRAAIEDLQARYLFALDFHDPDLYVSTFTVDGVLDYGSGEVKAGRAATSFCASSARGGMRPSGGATTRGSLPLGLFAACEYNLKAAGRPPAYP